ncbi:MAG TPA: hypothetical protein VN673_06775 [Clostridia bacterium]|nr:hypothetical protein [Clostridia bacterium]
MQTRHVESEVKKVRAKAGHKRRPSDPSLTGGERGETPEEKKARRKAKPEEPPIIQKTPEGGYGGDQG